MERSRDEHIGHGGGAGGTERQHAGRRGAARSRFDTIAVHAGDRLPLADAIPTATPIYATSTFLSENAAALDEIFGGTRKSYVYARYANPTVTALEEAINRLEGGAATVAFGSGMAALHAALQLVEPAPGDVVLAARDLYGATHTLLHTLFAPLGVTPRFADCNDTERSRRRCTRNPGPAPSSSSRSPTRLSACWMSRPSCARPTRPARW